MEEPATTPGAAESQPNTPASESAPPTAPGHPRERIQSFEQMKVWQEAHALTLRVFEVAGRIPTAQREGLAAIMEKTAIEIPKSIAEGFKRRGSRNKAHYYNLAQSALEALRYLLILARDLKNDVDYDSLANQMEQVSRMLDGLVRSMARSQGGGGGGGRHGGGEGGGRGDGGRDGGRRRRGGRGGRRGGMDEPSSHSSSDDWDSD